MGTRIEDLKKPAQPLGHMLLDELGCSRVKMFSAAIIAFSELTFEEKVYYMKRVAGKNVERPNSKPIDSDRIQMGTQSVDDLERASKLPKVPPSQMSSKKGAKKTAS